jgi:HD-GYP domain-containing protein (c-di-GMP phosphodiesterase class II)
MSKRPYRGGLEFDDTLAELRAGAGSQFDPEVVDAFVDVAYRGELFVSESQRST